MTVAKGADIPKERMLDAVEATAHACSLFETWAGIHASDLEPGALHVVDEVQIRLAAWQADRFGHVPTSDVHMTLGVIEELGEAFDEDATAEDCVDALGDVTVYASQLCTANRMAVRPVIELAEMYLKANHCRQQPIAIAGMLAHVALKHSQNIRGLGPVEVYRPRLVDALALMIAKALEDCTLGHELIVDAGGVLVTIGNEVMARKQGDAMIPKGLDTSDVSPQPELRARIMGDDGKMHPVALQSLHEAAAVLETPEAIAEGNFTAPTWKRLTSELQTEQCPIYDERAGVWCESDAQLRERIKQQRADLGL